MADIYLVLPIKNLHLLAPVDYWAQQLLSYGVIKYTAKKSPYSKLKINGVTYAVKYNKTVLVKEGFAHITIHTP
ncbi:MAG: hypothetical protein OEL77_02855 [Nitrosopumilus sp.]|nr:hypothetical protein [Nitrosopumilus sp.]MDH3384934.1 hypothetical protein [Nitrosopumilus sp.]